MNYRRNGAICPECGGLFFNLAKHQGKRVCQNMALMRDLRVAGYTPVSDIREHLVGVNTYCIPKPFQKFLRCPAQLGVEYLPTWVCALIVIGHWTDELVSRVENDQDLQTAYVLQYNITR